MRQAIRKANIDVIHIHEDDSLWTVIRSFSKNKPKSYTLIHEYSNNEQITNPTKITPEQLMDLFNYDIISLFEN